MCPPSTSSTGLRSIPARITRKATPSGSNWRFTRPACATIPVRLFEWSGEESHLGRADGAVRMIDELTSLELEPGQRVVLWGHHHAGNIFALATFLLSGRRAAVARFFRAVRIYYRWPLLGCVDIPVWNRVRRRLHGGRSPLRGVELDFVTFGTPFCYTWSPGAYSRLLRLVDPRGAVPSREVNSPGFFAWRSRSADRRLGRLLKVLSTALQPDDAAPADELGSNAATPGYATTVVVDYGEEDLGSGHSAYVRREWLLFHAEETVRRFYPGRAVRVA